MPRFYIVNRIENTEIELDFSAFVAIAKGMSITSAATSDDMGFVELGLSERFNLSIGVAKDGDIVISLFSTLNAEEIPPLRIQIVPDHEEVSAETVERRIRMLRQVYAIATLVNSGRSVELASLLERDPNADIESTLLGPEDRLYIASAGPGSFWVTVLTKSKAAYITASSLFSVMCDEGRELLLRRVRANTILKELEVEEHRFELEKHKVKGIIEVYEKIEKIKNDRVRQIIVAKFDANLRELGADGGLLLPPQNTEK
jgi:hypothetical protein